jgi:hypothetical protein
MMIIIGLIMFLCWFLVFQYSVIFVLCDADVFASELVECITQSIHCITNDPRTCIERNRGNAVCNVDEC